MSSLASLTKLKCWLEDRKNFRLISSTLMASTVLVSFLPCTYVKEPSEDLKSSTFAATLQYSHPLRVAHFCGISSSVPLLIELFLDFFSNMEGLYYSDRFLLLISIIVPSIIYLTLYQSSIITLIYNGLLSIQFNIIIHIVSCFFAESSPMPLHTHIYLVATSCYYFHRITGAFSLVYSGHKLILSIIKDIFYYMGVAGLLFVSFRWLHFVWKKPINKGESQYNAFIICNTYVSALWFTVALVIISNVVSSAYSLYDYNASCLIMYVSCFVVFANIVSILPGRLLRLHASNTEATLAMKRVFVRYISHEIRSPLNVVSAGLEYLQAKLKETPEQFEDDLHGLVDEIYVANETAISILNDLLHYESIDAGTLLVDLSWQPAYHLLANRLEPLLILASKHEVILQVIDNAGISNFFVSASASLGSESVKISKGGDSSENWSRDSPNLETSLSLTEEKRVNQARPPRIRLLASSLSSARESNGGYFLHVDIFRLEQVLRNLVTSALKFASINDTIVLKFEIISSTERFHFSNSMKSAIYSSDSLTGSYLRVKVERTGHSAAAAAAAEPESKHRNTIKSDFSQSLGLWICRKIIEMHHGIIYIPQPAESAGLTFTFELPLFAEIPSELARLQQQHSNDQEHQLQHRMPLERIMREVSHEAERRKNNLSAKFGPSDKKSNFLIEFMSSFLSNAKEREVDTKGKDVLQKRPSHSPSNQGEAEDNELGIHGEGGLSNEKVLLASVGPIDHGSRRNLMAPSLEAEPEPEREASCTVRSAAASRCLRVLIADDSSMNRKIIRRFIERESASNPQLQGVPVEILEADDGNAVVATLRERQAQGKEELAIIFLDYLMKAMNGAETAFKIRNSPINFRGRIVAVTGNAMPEDISYLLSNGFDEVLVKPVVGSDIGAQLISV